MQRGGEGPIDLHDYNEIGEMDQALSRHADEIFMGLPGEQGKAIARSLFKILTDLRSDSRGVRRPARFSEVCAVANADSTAVCQVVEEFRSPGRTFLTPPVGVELLPETVLDISHESLMRLWGSCRQWAEEEARNARIYTRLAEQAALYAQQEASLYRDQELDIALDWKAKFRPNEPWAKRYHPGYPAAMDFLDRSVAARQKELADQEAVRQAELERSKREIERQKNEIQIKEHYLAKLRQTRRLLFAGFMLALSGMGVSLYLYSRAQQSEIRAMINSATRLASTGYHTESLVELIKAGSTARSFSEIIGSALTDNVRFQLARGLSSLRERNVLEDDLGPVREFAFSPDGKLVAAASSKGVVRLFDDKGNPLQELMNRNVKMDGLSSNVIYSVDFNRAGDRLASADSDGNLQIWNRQTKISEKIKGKGAVVVRFSPDGQLLAAGDCGGRVSFFSKDGIPSPALKPLQVANECIYAIAFHPDGFTFATTGWDGFVRLWNLKTGVLLRAFPVKDKDDAPGRQPAMVLGLSFSPDGKQLVTGSRDAVVRLWDLASGQLLAKSPSMRSAQEEPDIFGHQGPVLAVAFHPKQELMASGSRDGTFRLWRRAGDRLEQVQAFSAHGKMVGDVRFSADGQQLGASMSDGKIRLVNWQGDEFNHKRGHTRPVTGLAFTSDGKFLASISADQTLRFWDLARSDGRSNPPIQLDPTTTPRFTIQPGGKQFAITGKDGSIQLVTPAGAKIGELPKVHDHDVSDIQFHPKRTALASADVGGTVKLWDLKARQAKIILRPEVGKAGVAALAFNPDGSTLVAARQDGSLTIIFLNTIKKANMLPKSRDLVSDLKVVRQLQFSPDGQSLYVLGEVSGTQSTAGGLIQRLQVGGSWENRDRLGQASESIMGFAVSPDSRTIITANKNGSVSLWLPNGEEISTLADVLATDSSPANVAWAGDGSKIAFAGKDGEITFWDVRLDALVRRACERLDDYLSTHRMNLKDVAACHTPERLKRAAIALEREGERQVKKGDEIRARESFRLASQWNKDKPINPDARVAPISLNKAIQFATATGDVKDAEHQFERAHSLDSLLDLIPNSNVSSVDVDPHKAAVYWATKAFLDKSDDESDFSKQVNYFDKIILYLSDIVKLNPSLFDAGRWNDICWYGSIKGRHDEVRPACDLAVRMSDPSMIFQTSDTRGLNAALRGDRKQAISDFRAFLADEDILPKLRKKRANWVKLMESGVPPAEIFTPRVLKDLEDESQ